MVLVDHAAEHPPAPHRHIKGHDNRLVMIGWPLLPGLVRPVIVVVPGAGPQHNADMARAINQQPVRAPARTVRIQRSA